MKTLFTTFIKALSHIITTFLCAPFCAACKTFLIAPNKLLCQPCRQAIEPIVSTTIQLTGTKSMTVFAISDYKNPLKKLILAKAGSNIAASRQLGTLIWEITSIKNISFDVIIPIPLHTTRFAWRGYNQAQEIARVIARKSKKPIFLSVKRTKKTKPQSVFSAVDRESNVADAFLLCKKAANTVRGKHILLVDDLMTTGSTLKAVAKLLLSEKPASITAVVACRVK